MSIAHLSGAGLREISRTVADALEWAKLFAIKIECKL
jgi:hypothetical protein